MLETFKKYICSNCKAECDKGIVVTSCDGIKRARCTDYEKKHELEGYKEPIKRTADQIKPIMRFTQEY